MFNVTRPEKVPLPRYGPPVWYVPWKFHLQKSSEDCAGGETQVATPGTITRTSFPFAVPATGLLAACATPGARRITANVTAVATSRCPMRSPPPSERQPFRPRLFEGCILPQQMAECPPARLR